MRTRLVKWLCAAVSFIALCRWPWIADYDFALRVMVCSGAAVVAIQAFHAARHHWIWLFLAIALLFNPVLPVLSLTNKAGLVAIGLTAVAFVVSLAGLKQQPLLSIPSITDRTPGSESL